MALLIGGVGMGDQEKALEKGVDVLIATPGRLLDWFERGKVLLGGVNIVVLDEADRMLDMGFMPDVERILTPAHRPPPDAPVLGHHAARRAPDHRAVPQRAGADRGQPARPPRSKRSTPCWFRCRAAS